MWSDPDPRAHARHPRTHVGRSKSSFVSSFALRPSPLLNLSPSPSLSFSLVAALLCSSCTPTAPLPPTVGRQFSLSESDGQVIRHSNPSRMRRKRSQREVFWCSRKPLPLASLLRSKKCRKTALSRRLSLFYFRPASLGDRLLYFGKLAAAVLPPSLLPPPPPTICGTVPVRYRPSPRSLKASWPPPPPFPPTLGIARPPDAAAAAACRSPLRSLGQAKVRGRGRESMPRSDCLPEPGSPLCSLCSPHASAAAGDVTAASAPLPPLKLLLLRHIVHSSLSPSTAIVDRSPRVRLSTSAAAVAIDGPTRPPSAAAAHLSLLPSRSQLCSLNGDDFVRGAVAKREISARSDSRLVEDSVGRRPPDCNATGQSYSSMSSPRYARSKEAFVSGRLACVS